MQKISKPISRLTLKEVRARSTLTVAEAGIKCGINKATYHNIERGRSFPNSQTLSKIANAYGLKESTLIKIILNTRNNNRAGEG